MSRQEKEIGVKTVGSQLTPPVAIVGMSNWLDTTAELFHRAEIQCDVLDLPRTQDVVSMWLFGRWRRFYAFHCVGQVSLAWRIIPLAKVCGRKIAWHWCGTDVLRLKNKSAGWRDKVFRFCIYRFVDMHVADSPELAEELRKLGIQASVVRLLPQRIEAEPLPLPDRCIALAYWADETKDFYGGNLILQLAEEFPDIEFRILRAHGKNEQPQSNVKFLGIRCDMPTVYADSTVLIRLPAHDSLSAMVLEMLARGRYVIYNKFLEGCYVAKTYEQAKKALAIIQSQTEPNVRGAKFVRETFCLNGEATKLAKVYKTLLPQAAYAAGKMKI